MDKTYFEMRMHKFEIEIHLKAEKGFYQGTLFPKYERYSNKRFNEICDWLVEYYDNKYLFPQPSDFRRAMEMSAPTFCNYKPTPLPEENQNAEVARLCGELSKKFSVRKTPKKDPVKFMEKMGEQNMIYAIRESKWVKRDRFKELGGNKDDFRFPEKEIV